MAPGLPAHISVSHRHTFIYWAYLEKLYKETCLNPFDNCVPVSRRGRGLDGDGFFLLLGSLVQAYGESSDFELIALAQKQAGGADFRKEYCMLSAELGAF